MFEIQASWLSTIYISIYAVWFEMFFLISSISRLSFIRLSMEDIYITFEAHNNFEIQSIYGALNRIWYTEKCFPNYVKRGIATALVDMYEQSKDTSLVFCFLFQSIYLIIL